MNGRDAPLRHAVVLAGTVVASLAAYASGSVTAFGPLLFVWVVMAAFYLFSLPWALVHFGLAGVGYALAIAAESPPGDHVDSWLAVMAKIGRAHV